MSQSGEDWRDGEADHVTALSATGVHISFSAPFTARLCSPSPELQSCDDRELIYPPLSFTSPVFLTRVAEGSGEMTALSALGCVPPLRSCADSVSLSALSSALSRVCVSER